jgi:hypothetical protein
MNWPAAGSYWRAPRMVSPVTGSAGLLPLVPGRPGRQARHQRSRRDQRYEKGKMTPTVEVVVRLAEIFDVSTDYLLVEGAPRRRFGGPGDEFTERLSMAGHLSAADKAAISHIINGLLANTRIRAALDEAQ